MIRVLTYEWLLAIKYRIFTLQSTDPTRKAQVRMLESHSKGEIKQSSEAYEGRDWGEMRREDREKEWKSTARGGGTTHL